MRTLLKGATVHLKDGAQVKDIVIEEGLITGIDNLSGLVFDQVKNLDGLHVFPGFVDVHVHLREPGFFYKETIKTGTRASAKGGFTSVFTMPNLNPAPDTLENLKAQLDIIEKDAVIDVYPYGCITMGQKGVGELSRMEDMAPYVKGFSDDGRGVQTEELMTAAMNEAKRLNKIIVAHCEDNSELNPGGAIHEGEYAKKHGIGGINSRSEYAQVERDIELVKKTGCKYHVCHVSTKESVDLIRMAKKEGMDITCETAPHYLILTDDDLKDEGRFKMNPPLREWADREALIEGILDGTIDMIATDHAPHSADEKSKGLGGSLFGIVGIESCFQLMLTRFVRPGILTLEKLMALMVYNPAKRFGISAGLEPGQAASLTVWDLEKQETIQPEKFLSMGKATPFEGETVYGQCKLTLLKGETAYEF